jgi:hypothetical protein
MHSFRRNQVEGHRGTTGFGLGFTNSALRPRASYVDASSHKVDIRPLKSQALADTGPGTSCKQHQEAFHRRELPPDRKGLLRGDDYGVSALTTWHQLRFSRGARGVFHYRPR